MQPTPVTKVKDDTSWMSSSPPRPMAQTPATTSGPPTLSKDQPDSAFGGQLLNAVTDRTAWFPTTTRPTPPPPQTLSDLCRDSSNGSAAGGYDTMHRGVRPPTLPVPGFAPGVLRLHPPRDDTRVQVCLPFVTAKATGWVFDTTPTPTLSRSCTTRRAAPLRTTSTSKPVASVADSISSAPHIERHVAQTARFPDSVLESPLAPNHQGMLHDRLYSHGRTRRTPPTSPPVSSRTRSAEVRNPRLRRRFARPLAALPPAPPPSRTTTSVPQEIVRLVTSSGSTRPAPAMDPESCCRRSSPPAAGQPQEGGNSSAIGSAETRAFDSARRHTSSQDGLEFAPPPGRSGRQHPHPSRQPHHGNSFDPDTTATCSVDRLRLKPHAKIVADGSRLQYMTCSMAASLPVAPVLRRRRGHGHHASLLVSLLEQSSRRLGQLPCHVLLVCRWCLFGHIWAPLHSFSLRLSLFLGVPPSSLFCPLLRVCAPLPTPSCLPAPSSSAYASPLSSPDIGSLSLRSVADGRGQGVRSAASLSPHHFPLLLASLRSVFLDVFSSSPCFALPSSLMLWLLCSSSMFSHVGVILLRARCEF